MPVYRVFTPEKKQFLVLASNFTHCEQVFRQYYDDTIEAFGKENVEFLMDKDQ